MQTYRGQSEIAVEGHNVKIGAAASARSRLFAQTQQLIAGGRHPELRCGRRWKRSKVLASSNWITFEARDQAFRWWPTYFCGGSNTGCR